MKVVKFIFESRDGVNIHTEKWLPEKSPRAVVQIAHGMAEHIHRYEELAAELNAAGYIVYGNDHRGHGKTAGSPENIGYLADRKGWELLVEDMHRLTGIIKEENPGLPIILLGHSAGSYLTRTYLQRYGGDIEGAILCGSGQPSGSLLLAGVIIAKMQICLKGKRSRSILLNNMSFGSFNKAFKPNRTEFDWLNRDEKEVDKYIVDPYCGGIFTAGYFYDLATGLINLLNGEKNISKVLKELPLYFISGEKCPVGAQTKGVLKAIDSLRKAGFKNIEYKFYPGARHEILHEINKEEVFNDITVWLDKHLR